MAVKKGTGWLVLSSLFGVMFFFSIAATMTGTLIPEISAYYDLSYSQAGLIGSVQSIGGFAANILGSMFSDRFPKLRLICIMFAVYTVMLYGLGLVPPYMLLIACFLVIGVASSALSLLISAYISESYPEKRTAYLNINHAFYGLGSLTGPLYISLLDRLGIVWNRTFLWFGVFCTAITVVLLAVCRTGGVTVKKAEQKGVLREVFTNPGLLIISAACLLYMGQQSAVNLWIVSYVEVEMQDENWAGMVLTLYWTGVMLGRLLQSVISRYIDSGKWLCVCCSVSAVLFVLAVIIGSPAVMGIMLCVGAVLTGAAFPSMMALGCACCPAQAGSATALVCLGSGVGGMIFPPLVGLLADLTSFSVAVYTIPVLLVLCTGMLFLFLRQRAKNA